MNGASTTEARTPRLAVVAMAAMALVFIGCASRAQDFRGEGAGALGVAPVETICLTPTSGVACAGGAPQAVTAERGSRPPGVAPSLDETAPPFGGGASDAAFAPSEAADPGEAQAIAPALPADPGGSLGAVAHGTTDGEAGTPLLSPILPVLDAAQPANLGGDAGSTASVPAISRSADSGAAMAGGGTARPVRLNLDPAVAAAPSSPHRRRWRAAWAAHAGPPLANAALSGTMVDAQGPRGRSAAAMVLMRRPEEVASGPGNGCPVLPRATVVDGADRPQPPDDPAAALVGIADYTEAFAGTPQTSRACSTADGLEPRQPVDQAVSYPSDVADAGGPVVDAAAPEPNAWMTIVLGACLSGAVLREARRRLWAPKPALH